MILINTGFLLVVFFVFHYLLKLLACIFPCDEDLDKSTTNARLLFFFFFGVPSAKVDELFAACFLMHLGIRPDPSLGSSSCLLLFASYIKELCAYYYLGKSYQLLDHTLSFLIK